MMKAIHKIYFLFFVLCACCVHVQGQATPISIPYAYGFEDVDSLELQRWELNYGTEGELCYDRWVVGDGTQSEGSKSLYISNDGYSPQYGYDHPNVVVSYFEFGGPAVTMANNRYNISFDWKSTGKAGVSDLYVLLLDERIEASVPIPVSDAASSVLADNVKRRTIKDDATGRSVLNDADDWESFSFSTALSQGSVYHLVFVWVNANTDSTRIEAGACIDNIQITSASYNRPENLKVDASCDTTWVSWEGYDSNYELEYKLRGGFLQWQRVDESYIDGEVAAIPNLEEGLYDFRVRTVFDGDNVSAWLTKSKVVVYCPENHCINYTDLDAAYTYYGKVGINGQPTDVYPGKKDFGSDDIRSRHTVCWSGQEDPRTGGGLSMVPPGEVASVRLGNWNTGSEMEGIRYTYYVEVEPTILLLRYAIVLEDPGHTGAPRFTLEVMGEDGPIGEEGYACGEADFSAEEGEIETGESGWHKTGRYYWKEWTAVGLDISGRRPGEELTIELTTYDCTAGAHFGYAYFTLDCLSAAIQTNSCGDDKEIEVSAPDGFAYWWTNPTGRGDDWHSEEQEITIEKGDTTTYYCEVSFLEEMACNFTLSTKAYPRYPVADFDYVPVSVDCRNMLQFDNKSYIKMVYDDREEPTTQPCEAYSWKFTDQEGKVRYSSLANPELVCSNEGDVIDVELTAYLSSNSKEEGCSNVLSMRIEVPAIGEMTQLMSDTICQNTQYGGLFGKGSRRVIYGGTSGVHEYMDTVPSVRTGCDSITTLNLTVLPVYDVEVDTTICFGDVYELNGVGYSRDTTVVKNLAALTWCGCDSIVTLHLSVRDEITFDVVPIDVLDGPNSGRIDLENVSVDPYTWSLNGVMDAPLDKLAGGDYMVVVYNEFGCASEPIEVTVLQDCLEIGLDSIPEICGDEPHFEISYQQGKGYATTYNVLFDDAAKAAGFADMQDVMVDGEPVRVPLPQGLRPDTYRMDVVFEDVLCENLVFPVSFTVKYPASMVVQKWNDVLAILNAAHNGGYEFSSYQWYKDGEPLEGETGAYLYVGDEGLEVNAEYAVLLTRSDDSVSVFTCPLVPEWREETVGLYPTVVPAASPVMLSVQEAAMVSVYDAMGILQKKQSFEAGAGQPLYVSDRTGYYFVKVALSEGESSLFKVLVR